MNRNELHRRLAEIAAANATNKLRIQRKRGRFARTIASTKDLPKPDTFPTRYKYG